jgi:aminopeptidase
MNYFEEKINKYASLAVEIGVNVQPGQTLVISAPIIAAEFVRKVVKKAYEVGAKNVHVEWDDDDITRLKYELAPSEAFLEFPMWHAKGFEEMAINNAAFLTILASDPDLLRGIDPQRIADANKTKGTAMQLFRSYGMSGKISRSVVAIPSQAWADKVYPTLEKDQRIDALWDAIFHATRVDLDNPVEAWREHTNKLGSKVDYLNKKKFKALHYKDVDTDLTIELPDEHLWVCVGSQNEKGILFMENIPSEEVLTAPLKTGVNGTVTSTKPLSYGGNLIKNIKITFNDGRIVAYTAEEGYETLKGLIETDEGSHFLGEVALVPHKSPISDTNIVFFNTLFDENASNHLAIGRAFAFCLKGGKAMSKNELATHGLNESLTHVDFMIGSDIMDIDGILPDGTIEPVFRKGNWAF